MANDNGSESLGQVLLNVGVITKEQLNKALDETGGKEKGLPEALIRNGFVTEAQIIKAIGLKSQIPYFDSLDGLISEESSKLIPEELSRKHQVIALFNQGDSILLAMINPYDVYAIDDVTRYTKMKVEPVISTRKTMFNAISKIYEKTSEQIVETDIKEAESEIGMQTDKSLLEIVDYSHLTDLSDIEIAKKAPIIKLVDRIILEAINKKASDIHIEPKTGTLVIRYRVDGMLHQEMVVPRALSLAVSSRIKIMAKLDISETRRPQDGRIAIKLKDRLIDLRISVIPTVTGEKIVVRILDKEGLVFDLGKLGMNEEIKKEFIKFISYPNGIVLVTGPTGSGKTTTLYSSLNILMDKTKNISTLEDPVEYQIDGVNQVQVNVKTGMTFANGLRSLLRQDPDILLVGEIRDQETAAISIQAALTGHLVLATLHTNDACGALSRMIDMDVEPFLLNTALLGVVAQRLIRLLCPICKEAYKPEKMLLKELKLNDAHEYTFYHPKGCKECFDTGYKGRTGIYELLSLTKEVRQQVLEKSSYDNIYEAARKTGFSNMLEQARSKIIDGTTSAEEVLRVVRSDL